MGETKFKYNDWVEVVKGFHRERTGRCRQYKAGQYLVSFGCLDGEWFSEDQLEAASMSILDMVR